MKDFIVPKIKVSEVVMPDINMPKIEFPPFPEFPDYPDFPEIKAPVVNVNVPDVVFDMAKLKIPAPIVNIPEAKITVTPTPVNFPKEMEVKGMKELIDSVSRETENGNIFEEITSKSPLAVMIVDKKGKQIDDFGGEFLAPSTVAIRVGTTAVGQDNLLPVTTDGFSIPVFDTQVIDESLAPATTTITYKRAGVTVATKTISVSGTTTTISVSIV
jgi:hypothetical protein